jgi:dTDP-4-amino-4,6-dideoxygalactose transaminase
VGRPNVGDRDRLVARIDDMLRRRWLTNDGPFVRELEERVAEHVGVRHAVAVCNATVGLELAARAAGIDGEVIVPSLTFVASAHALRWIGLTPVFCDVDPATHNIDPEHAASVITPRTTAILGVHLWGRPCDTDALQAIADRYGLRLIFDAAHAFSCSHQGRMIGGFGDVEVFSFHATKFFNSGEGGAIVTDDDEIAEAARRMRNFGYTGHDEVVEPGTNGKMNELAAAMGLTSFESLDRFVETNRRHYRRYAAALGGLPGVTVARYDEGERCNYQYVVIEVDEDEAGISRDAVVDVLRAEGVLARRYFYPGCHRMRPYADAGISLPHSERLSEQLLALPTGTGVDDATVEAIASLFTEVIQSGAEIANTLEVQPAG